MEENSLALVADIFFLYKPWIKADSALSQDFFCLENRQEGL